MWWKYVIMYHLHWFFSNYILRNLLDTQTRKIWKTLVWGRRYSTKLIKKNNTGVITPISLTPPYTPTWFTTLTQHPFHPPAHGLSSATPAEMVWLSMAKTTGLAKFDWKVVAQHGTAWNSNIQRVNGKRTTVTFICMWKAWQSNVFNNNNNIYLKSNIQCT